MKSIKLALFIFIQFCIYFGIRAQNNSIDAIQADFSAYSKQTGLEKIYIHFDKPEYYAGDRIWFKAYAFKGDNSPMKDSVNLYSELVDARGNLYSFSVLLLENGSASGHIKLSDSISDGNYLFRAYTDRIMDIDDQFAFSRHFYIKNPGYENIIPQNDIRFNRRLNRQIENKEAGVFMYFFPEGGNIVESLQNRIAFKVTDGLGNGLNVQGDLVDSNGNSITSFNSYGNGLGLLEFQPAPGSNYKVRISYNGKNRKEFDLPVIQKNGIVMRVSSDDTMTVIEITENMMAGTMPGNFSLLVHSSGKILLTEAVEFKDGKFSKELQTADYKGGVYQATVLDENNSPVAERLFYIMPRNVVSFGANLFKQEHENRQFLQLILSSYNSLEEPVSGNYSLSVQTGDFPPINTSQNILGYITFESELQNINKNMIEFIATSDQPHYAIDLIMLTHGWRRFSWDKLRNYKPVQQNQFMSGIRITGKLYDPVERRVVPNYAVKLEIKGDYNKTFHGTTDKDGIFVFDNLMLYGPVKIEISSVRTVSGVFPEIELFTKDFQTDFSFEPIQPQRITDRGPGWRRVRSSAQSSTGGRGSVEEPKSIYGAPDQTIIVDDKLSNYRSVYQILADKAIGMTVQGGQIVFRGQSSFMLSSEPVFVLDGNMVEKSTLLNMPPFEIQRLEIFKGANAVIFGSRGTNGAIVGYSRRYSASKNGIYEAVIVGFESPVEFYSDVTNYHKLRAQKQNYIQTIHWDPRVITSPDGEAINIFPFLEGVKNIKVVIEGVGANGEIGFGEFVFELN